MRNRGAAAHPECIGAGVGLGSVAYKTRSQGMCMAWLGRLWLGEVGGRGGTCEGSSELEWGKQKKPEGRGGNSGKEVQRLGAVSKRQSLLALSCMVFSSVLFTDSPGVIRLRLLILSPGDFSFRLSYSWKTLSIGFLFSTG